MDDGIDNIYGLMMGVGGSGDVIKLKEFFDDGKYGRDGFAWMISRLIKFFLALEEFVWH